MNTQALKTFVAVAERGSFSAAADDLHVTQPAVSKRIAQLEQHLGTVLFDRVGKQVMLTQSGQVLVPQAREILAAWQDAERRIHNLTSQVAGELSLATSHHIGLHRLAPVLKTFTDAYPDVKLDIRFEDSEVAHDMVRHGVIELAVATLNPAGDEQLSYEAVWRDPLTFVSAAPVPGPISLAGLAELPSVLPGTGTYTGRIVLERFRSAGVALQPALSTNYLETISMLVAVGLGWSVLPHSMIGGLAALQVDAEPMSRTLGAIRNPARSVSNAAAAFLEVLRGHAALK